MIWVDWFLLAALLVSILIGVLRGFTREVLGLATWIVALGASLIFAPSVHVLDSHIATPSLRIAGAYALVFFGAMVVGSVITAVVSSLVRKSPLSGVDRAIGGGFGLIRGVLIAVMLVWLVGMTPARQDPWWSQSVFIDKLQWLAQSFQKAVPEDWANRLRPPAAKEGV